MNAGAIKGVSKSHAEELEQYFTPPDVAAKVLSLIPSHGRAVLDPCAGAGALLPDPNDPVARGRVFFGTDIEPQAPHISRMDWRESVGLVDASVGVLTNPPFSQAADLAEAALSRSPAFLALLLPASALGGQARARRLWRAHPPRDVFLLGRVRFGGPAIEAKLARGEKLSGAMQDYILVVWCGLGHATLFHWRNLS